MIEVKNVSKSFDGFRALNNVSLDVEGGSVYGLVGPNGAGKTTILKTIAGVYKSDAGTIKVDGASVFENDKTAEKMFFISDDLYYFTTYSIIDTARFYAGIYKNWSWERFESLKEVFKIDTNRRVRRLSKGMQKQVAFWMAISAMPKVLLLDEPVDGLDPVMRRAVWKTLLADVAERRTTVLVSSHNLRELEDVCDHVGIMHGGKMVLQKALDDVKGQTHKIQVAFDGEIPKSLLEVLKPLHIEKFGSVNILIVKGERKQILNTVMGFSPLIADILPLTLEEVFIYELGGLGYEFKDIIF